MAKANLEFNLSVISHEETFLQSMTTESASLNLTMLGRIPEFTPIHEVTAQPQENAAPIAISQSFIVNYPEAIQEIANLLADNIRVFLHLKDLDREVLAKRQKHPQLSPDEALEEVLLDWESSSLGGFDEKPFIVALAISEADFNEVLQIPRLFHDMGITYWHGIETHRLQWQIIMREMRANPEKFKDNNGTRLTASLLNTAITNARIKDSNYSLFHELFDRDNRLPTGSCPDTLLNSLRLNAAEFPGLGETFDMRIRERADQKVEKFQNDWYAEIGYRRITKIPAQFAHLVEKGLIIGVVE